MEKSGKRKRKNKPSDIPEGDLPCCLCYVLQQGFRAGQAWGEANAGFCIDFLLKKGFCLSESHRRDSCERGSLCGKHVVGLGESEGTLIHEILLERLMRPGKIRSGVLLSRSHGDEHCLSSDGRGLGGDECDDVFHRFPFRKVFRLKIARTKHPNQCRYYHRGWDDASLEGKACPQK